MCTDPLDFIIVLLRYALRVLYGLPLENAWQAIRTFADMCSKGPLG